jgi:hypothetical protein
MGDPIPQPAKTTRTKPAGISRAPRHGRRLNRLDNAYQFVDFVMSRLLVLMTIVGLARGNVSTEMVAAVWAALYVLRSTPRR